MNKFSGARTKSRSSARPGSRTARKVQKMNEKILKLKTKTRLRNVRSEAKTADLKRRAKSGSRMAQRKLERFAKHEAKVQEILDKPALLKASKKSAIETEAKVKQTKARGAAVTAATSALGGSYYAGKEAESKAKEAEAKATSDVANAIVESVKTVPSVTTDEYSGKSTAGLITGVR